MSQPARIHHLHPRPQPVSKKPYLQPVPREIVFDLLQHKIAQVQSGEIEKLSFEMCVVSYLNDRLRCKQGTDRFLKSQNDYARMWGWSKGWVNRNWQRIEEAAEQQRTFYAGGDAEKSESDRQMTGKRPASDRKSPNAGSMVGESDRQMTGKRPASDRHNIEEPLDHTDQKILKPTPP